MYFQRRESLQADGIKSPWHRTRILDLIQ